MSLIHLVQLPFVASGLVVGALVGLTGVGGGSLMTPLLVLLFGIHPATAVGTDLLYAGLTKISGSTVHSAHGSIEWRVVRRLALGSAPMAIVTLLALKYFGAADGHTNSAITTTLGIALLLTSVSLLFRPWLVAKSKPFFSRLSDGQIAGATVALGAALGVLVSISSVGAGAVGVTALLLLYPRLPMARIVGSDIAHAVPLTLIAGIGHWAMGAIDWHLMVVLLMGSLPGIVIGSYFATRVPETALRLLLAATLLLVAGRLVSSEWSWTTGIAGAVAEITHR